MTALKLKKQLSKINDVIPRGSKVYYFDYPVYNNVGDMLIWQGTEKFFKENNIRVIKRFSYHMVKFMLEKNEIQVQKNIIIVCQGGGNFGDLYKIHQELRILLVKNFPSNRIVVLPQSIYYKDKSESEKDFKVFRKHDDFHLYVRDIESFNIASKYLKTIYLSQDMAHALYPIKTNTKPTIKNLYFLRKDKERVDSDYIKEINPTQEEFDWHLLYSPLDRKILNLFSRAHNSYKIQKLLSSFIISKLYFIYTSYIIKKAIKLFEKHENIITSRLHGHILACLMDKKNIVIDNSYGKNSGYYNCWTNKIKNAKLIDEKRK
ncbi:polysaccharide pyruvyl transferase family protein [Alkalihalobacillus sp. BA299]|uniref:polysaccharide pyruvyl transferase family protein n=1 Tax=Alkalihalobacillus sp. BA299 TaxID=2815938 RepID=UPI001ADB6D2E|nr:polysaccharide pyruvyl transferase family protein [Alkalihalobacillus sp. BA299]